MLIERVNLLAFTIKAVRKLQYVSRKDAAKKMKMSEPYLSLLETEMRPVTERIYNSARGAFGEEVKLKDKEVRRIQELVDNIDPKLLLIAASVIDHRLKYQARPIEPTGKVA